MSLAHPTPSRVFGPSAVVVTRRGASAQSPLWPRSPKSEVKPHSEHLIMKTWSLALDSRDGNCCSPPWLQTREEEA